MAKKKKKDKRAKRLAAQDAESYTGKAVA